VTRPGFATPANPGNRFAPWRVLNGDDRDEQRSQRLELRGLHRYLLKEKPNEATTAAERGLQDYLLDGRSGEESEHVAWTP